MAQTPQRINLLIKIKRIRKSLRKKGVRTRAFWWLLGVFSPTIVGVILFVSRTMEFPSTQNYKRNLQIIGEYFPKSNKDSIVVKMGQLNSSSNTYSFVAFRKDPFYDALFGVTKEPQDVFQIEDQPIEKKVLLFEENSFNILSQVFSFVFPLRRIFEISGPNGEYVRLLDVSLIDLDSDGTQEVLAIWSNYSAGSGAINYPVIIKFQMESVSYETFPIVKQDPNNFNFYILKNRKILMAVNGEERYIPCNQIHTDVFYTLEDIDEDKMTELVMAYPKGDWEYHYGPQTWHACVFEYKGGKLIFDPDYKIATIFPKEKGLGLSEVHGYVIKPAFGQLFWMWCPSWLDLTETKYQMLKGRRKSDILIQLQKTKKLN